MSSSALRQTDGAPSHPPKFFIFQPLENTPGRGNINNDHIQSVKGGEKIGIGGHMGSAESRGTIEILTSQHDGCCQLGS